MKRMVAAVLASFTIASSQAANAETLLELLFPRTKVDQDTSRPELDNSSTGSVERGAAATIIPERQPAKRASYPEAFYLNYQ